MLCASADDAAALNLCKKCLSPANIAYGNGEYGKYNADMVWSSSTKAMGTTG